MKQYLTLGVMLAVVQSCIQPPLPPEPPITVVISQCRGWQDAGEPVVVQDPPKTPPSPEESAALNP